MLKIVDDASCETTSIESDHKKCDLVDHSVHYQPILRDDMRMWWISWIVVHICRVTTGTNSARVSWKANLYLLLFSLSVLGYIELSVRFRCAMKCQESSMQWTCFHSSRLCGVSASTSQVSHRPICYTSSINVIDIELYPRNCGTFIIWISS